MPCYRPDCHDSRHPVNLSIESGSYFPPHYHYLVMASQVTLRVKNPPANAGEDAGLIPGLEDPLEEEMATYSNIVAWKTPQTVWRLSV